MNQKNSFELSTYEKVLFNICQTGDFLVMSSSFIQNESNYKLNQDLVKKALIYMQQRHPFLNTYVDNQLNKNRMYLKIPDQYISSKISFEWLDLTQNQMNRKNLIDESVKFYVKKLDFKDQNLLWKVQIIEYLQEGTLKYLMNLVVNMLVSDGLSITCLSVEIVNILNALIDGKECDEMNITLEPVDSLNSLCEKIYKRNQKLKTVNSKKSKLVLPEKFRTNQKGYLLDFFNLDKSITSKIIEKSKAQNLRLSGYFHTIVLYAMKKLYDENGVVFPKKVPIEMAANLRIRLEPKVDLNSCRFFTALLNFTTEETKFGKFENFWQDAKYVHELIQAYTNIETGDLFMFTNYLLLEGLNQVFRVTNSIENACKILNFFHPIECDLNISNLGRFVNDSVKEFNGNLSIKEIYCSDLLVSVPRITSAIVMHIIYWKGETMVQMGANNYYIAEEYFKRLKELILEFIVNTLD